MADATCATCPFASVWPSTQAGDERIICHHVATSGEFNTGEPSRLVTWWCSEHPLRQRDRLAAMAMQAVLANPASIEVAEQDVASAAYSAADAMLAEAARSSTTSDTDPEEILP